MLILWIKKSLSGKENNQANKNEDFKKHDKEMKKFRQEHPEPIAVDPIEFITPDGGPLAPVISVKLGKNTQN